MSSLICQVAQICHRAAEFLAPFVSVLVRASAGDYILVFLELRVNVGEEVRVNVEFRKHVSAVDGETLHLVADFKRVGYHFRMVREKGCHLLLALEIFLLGVSEPVRVVYVRVGSQADKPVVNRSVLLAHEMHVIRRYDFHTVFGGQVEKHFVIFLLPLVHFK